MAYLDVPLAPQRIKDSQPIIRQNFVEINALIDVDHYTFGSPTIGEHKKVTLPDQGLAPVFPGNDIGLFAQIPTAAPLTTVNELFIRRQDGTTTPITAASKNIDGWTYLPSGMLMKWGTVFIGDASFVAYPVGANIPAFNPLVIGNPFIVQVTLNPLGALTQNLTIGVDSAATTSLGFSIRIFPNTETIDIFYLAIGV